MVLIKWLPNSFLWEVKEELKSIFLNIAYGRNMEDIILGLYSEYVFVNSNHMVYIKII